WYVFMTSRTSRPRLFSRRFDQGCQRRVSVWFTSPSPRAGPRCRGGIGTPCNRPPCVRTELLSASGRPARYLLSESRRLIVVIDPPDAFGHRTVAAKDYR